MNKITKNIKEEIFNMIKKMESNTFLLPDSWSENIDIGEEGKYYRTYVGSRYKNRYINIEYGDIVIEIRGNDISVNSSIFSRGVSKNKVYDIIKEIYEEMHSFKTSVEGIKPIRKRIRDNIKKIDTLKNENKKLKLRIEDFNKVSKI